VPLSPPPHIVRSNSQVVRYFRGYVLEPDGSTGDSLEPDPVEGEPRELTDLHLPLDERVSGGVAVVTAQEERGALFVVALVRVERAADVFENVRWR